MQKKRSGKLLSIILKTVPYVKPLPLNQRDTKIGPDWKQNQKTW